jgi:hypothetical protein
VVGRSPGDGRTPGRSPGAMGRVEGRFCRKSPAGFAGRVVGNPGLAAGRSRLRKPPSCPREGSPVDGRPGAGRVAGPEGRADGKPGRVAGAVGRGRFVGAEGRLGAGRVTVGRLGVGRVGVGRPGVGRLGMGRLGRGVGRLIDGDGRLMAGRPPPPPPTRPPRPRPSAGSAHQGPAINSTMIEPRMNTR